MKIIAIHSSDHEPTWTDILDTDLMPVELAAEFEECLPHGSISLTYQQQLDINESQCSLPCFITGLIHIYDR